MADPDSFLILDRDHLQDLSSKIRSTEAKIAQLQAEQVEQGLSEVLAQLKVLRPRAAAEEAELQRVQAELHEAGRLLREAKKEEENAHFFKDKEKKRVEEAESERQQQQHFIDAAAERLRDTEMELKAAEARWGPRHAGDRTPLGLMGGRDAVVKELQVRLHGALKIPT